MKIEIAMRKETGYPKRPNYRFIESCQFCARARVLTGLLNIRCELDGEGTILLGVCDQFEERREPFFEEKEK
jgi:hypothetical protein